MARLKHYGLKGAILLLGTRLLVTGALLSLIAVPEVLNESARLLILGAIVGHWLGHSGEDDAEAPPSVPATAPPPLRPQNRSGGSGDTPARSSGEGTL